MINKRNLIQIAGLFLIAMVLIFSFTYLGSKSKTTVKKPAKRTPVKVAPSSYHLEDNPILYSNKDLSQVKTMYLTVSRGNRAENTDHSWDEVNRYSVYDYKRMKVDRYQVAGLLQVGNEKGPAAGELGYGEKSPNATVQIRGQTSSRNNQKNYKIELKEDKGDWKGQTTINLNKHQSDSLRFRNMMAYALLRDIPQLLSLRTEFVRLYVKDKTGNKPNEFVDYGLYTQVEQLNKSGKKAHKLDTGGQLYKVNFFEFTDYDEVIKPETSPDYDQEAFEKLLEVKGSANHNKMINLIKTVNNTSLKFDRILDQYFDTENLTYWMAFQILMGNRDTQNRNMYLYSPANSKRWYIIPWDHDASLFETEYGLDGVVGNTSWETGISNYWGNVLFQRALKTESFRKQLDAAVEDLYRNYVTPERVKGLSSTLAATVSPYVKRAPDSTGLGVSDADYQKILNALPKEVSDNYQTYKESFNKPMPFFITVPEKSGNKLKLSWGNAYDFDAEKVTYTVEVSKNYEFSDIIFKRENLNLTTSQMDFPSKSGQYFIRVKATNESGQSQYAFDYYVAKDSKQTGVKSFTINEDKTVSEDIYTEE